MMLEPAGRESAEHGAIGLPSLRDLDLSVVFHSHRVSSKGMTISHRKHGPLIFLVAPVLPGSTLEEADLAREAYRFAGVPHSGQASLAATIATGVWPESHGVVSRLQPHPDRLGYEIVRPDRATGGTTWSQAVGSGRIVGLCNWPHESMLAAGGDGRLDRIGMAAIAGLSGEVGGVLPPDSFAPSSMSVVLRESARPQQFDTVFAGLELLADRGPDLLMGWLPESSAGTTERLEGIEGIRARLSDAASREATVLILEQPAVADSIFQQCRGGPSPRLLVIGPQTLPISGRPRVDSLHGILGALLETEGAAPRVEPIPRVAGEGRLDGAGVSVQTRLSSFDLKQFEHTRSREIGASLMARGRHAEAEAWLVGALQTQHGVIDAPVVGLLVALLRRRQGVDAATRLLASVQGRIPEAIADGLVAFLDARLVDLDASGHLPGLSRLGPFVMQTLLIDLHRRGLLKKGGPWNSNSPDGPGSSSTPEA